jgi:hypothetical protein
MINKKDIEGGALKALKALNFQITGYYPYENVIHMVGLLKQINPLVKPIITVVGVAKSQINKETVDTFLKFGLNILAKKYIIFNADDIDKLDDDLRSLILKNDIDYFGRKEISDLLKRISITQDEVKDYKNIIDILSPIRIIESLPEFSQQIVPNSIEEICNRFTIKHDVTELMEDAIFAAFHYCFNYQTQKLGISSRFSDEPDGLVVTTNTQRFAFLYDSKSSQDGVYQMSKDDERAIIDYIEKKREVIKARHKSELDCFLIIGNNFKGDLKLRKSNIFKKTHNVLLVFMKANAFKILSLWAEKIPHDYKRLIDLKEIFQIDKDIIDELVINDYIKKFNQAHQSVY